MKVLALFCHDLGLLGADLTMFSMFGIVSMCFGLWVLCVLAISMPHLVYFRWFGIIFHAISVHVWCLHTWICSPFNALKRCSLMLHVLALVYASLFESFGMPFMWVLGLILPYHISNFVGLAIQAYPFLVALENCLPSLSLRPFGMHICFAWWQLHFGHFWPLFWGWLRPSHFSISPSLHTLHVWHVALHWLHAYIASCLHVTSLSCII